MSHRIVVYSSEQTQSKHNISSKRHRLCDINPLGYVASGENLSLFLGSGIWVLGLLKEKAEKSYKKLL